MGVKDNPYKPVAFDMEGLLNKPREPVFNVKSAMCFKHCLSSLSQSLKEGCCSMACFAPVIGTNLEWLEWKMSFLFQSQTPQSPHHECGPTSGT
eukprot:175700-Amphidinium_carterae.1